MEQDTTIWISGPTGSGKSSLARMLAGLGYAVVREEIPSALFRQFAADPVRHCEALQEEIMRSRLRQWNALPDRRRVAFDRSVDEDFHVFCRMHRGLGLLDDGQLARLQGHAAELQAKLPRPDLIVAMMTAREVLVGRVTPATHPPLIVDSLDRQLALYMDWLAGRREDVLRLDNTACSLQAVERLLKVNNAC